MSRVVRSTILAVALLGLAGCFRQSAAPAQAVPELRAHAHLDAAEQLKKIEDDWPLAIWHYQRFLETAQEEGIASAEIDRAKVQLEALRQDYVALYSEGALGALETENATLRRNNKALGDQIERLKADNAVLNSTLLKMQQASGRR
ncbi:MAG: hypothetical protein II943_09675 [Victivallales bacterium]|nr:hypothetical protein [Victivallales bacterium]